MKYYQFIQLVKKKLPEAAKTGAGGCHAAKMVYWENPDTAHLYNRFNEHVHSPAVEAMALHLGANADRMESGNFWFTTDQIKQQEYLLDFMIGQSVDSISEIEKDRICMAFDEANTEITNEDGSFKTGEAYFNETYGQ